MAFCVPANAALDRVTRGVRQRDGFFPGCSGGLVFFGSPDAELAGLLGWLGLCVPKNKVFMDRPDPS